MPRDTSSSSSSTGGVGHGRGRYAAVVEKGESAWKREWSSFISGVNLKRLRDGTSGVALKASADIERQIEVGGIQGMGSGVEVNDDGIPSGASASPANFSYLFSSAAERRAERDARDRAEKERRQAQKRELMAKKDPLSVLSKHQRAVHEAQQRGLQLDGMSRKERRDFLHLTVTEAQKKAEEQSREFKLHDLMDERLAWYQQGPHPIDLIAETLVRRKADKKAKQLGLKYNYLAPHPSWVAKRAQRRRECLLVGLGKRLVFSERMTGEDKEDDANASGCEVMVTDPLHNLTVSLREMGLLLGHQSPSAAAASGEAGALVEAAASSRSGDDTEEATGANKEVQHVGGGAVRGHRNRAAGSQKTVESAPSVGTSAGQSRSPPLPGKRNSSEADDESVEEAAAHVRLPNVGVLQDPSRIATSFVRRVVRDRTTALAIQQLNRTTNYLSSELVKGPSLRPEDAQLENSFRVRGLSTPQVAAAPAAAAAATSTNLMSSPKSKDAAAASKRSPVASPSDRKRAREITGGDNNGERRLRRRGGDGGADASATEAKPRKSKHTTSPSPKRGTTLATGSVPLTGRRTPQKHKKNT
ncbi:hypothetical protein JKF63_06278 [Porcisia hertigi]|uniref:Uncharacterized protein n=1 Tax=Porcisia hertigi TaxID=2761500 RepID=A0A836LIX7_9TRYP|nr:hypothetical protein JKF63_06278 [Porcisia hertigi]